MSTIHHRACHLCEAICGLLIETEGEQVLSIKGDPADPLSRGHICPKAVALKDIHEDPDRLRKPLAKTVAADGSVSWQEIEWEDALQRTAQALASAVQKHGVNSIGVYLGNPSVHNYGMLTHQGNLFRLLRTNNRFSATSVDQLPHHLASLWLFGHKLLFPIPDIDRSDFFLMLGGNPIASNGSIWTVPDVRKRIKALRARGGKLIVLDPRRTETAELASEHHFIRPGSDVLFLLALLNTLFAESLANPAHLNTFTTGLQEVEAAIADFTPEYAATHTGIEAKTIRRIARQLAAAEAGICYGRMGVSVTEFGALNQWLIQIINIASGNLDKEGGSLFTSPALDNVQHSSPGGFARHHSSVRRLPEFDRELPVAALAEEITDAGEARIRVMFTGAGNPVLSTPNGAQLDSAFEQLEFMVSLDPYLNETTRHADIILPPTSPLEHDHYDMAFHLNAVRNTTRFNEAIFEKPADSMHDWEIFSALGERLAKLLGMDSQPAVEPAQIIDMGLQAGPYGKASGSEHALSLEQLKANPSGIDLGPLQPTLPDRLMTPDKQIRCNTPEPMADLARVRQHFGEASNASLTLIGRRHVRSCNSWMHNYHRLVKGRDRCTLMMNPQDMAQRGIDDGAQVEVRSRVGKLQVVAEATEEIMRGVASLPHGYGHDRSGIRMDIAAQNAGVSCNDLTDHKLLDALSGNAALNSLPVEVSPC